MLAWLVVALTTFGPSGLAATLPPPPVATFSDVDGDVTVYRGAKREEIDGEEDVDLFEGDEIRTVAGATATISFLDHHLVRLGERTTLVIRTIKSNPATGSFLGRVSLAAGRLFASFGKLTVPGSGFSVQTGGAVAAVRGTTFAIEADETTSTVAVSDGTVSTSALDAAGQESGAVDVPAGQETNVDHRSRALDRPAAIAARHAWVHEHLAAIHGAAERHRAMRASGELGTLRQLRRRARAGILDPQAPEARVFLAAHPEFAERLARHAARHKRIREHRGARQERREERHEERREKRARR